MKSIFALLLTLCVYNALAANVTEPVLVVMSGIPDISTFTNLVKSSSIAGQLNDTSRDFTVFAPTNTAMSNLDETTKNRLNTDSAFKNSFVSYAVVEGQKLTAASLASGTAFDTLEGDGSKLFVQNTTSGLFINNAQVQKSDVPASNGVIHETNVALIAPTQNTIDYINTQNNTQTFANLIRIAGLEDTFNSGESTVFVPTDAAFNNSLPHGSLTALEDEKNRETLNKIIEYHVVNSVRYAPTFIAPFESLQTREGSNVNITHSGAVVHVNNGAIISPDHTTFDGVVHKIDVVLIPPGVSLNNLTTSGNATTGGETGAASSQQMGVILLGVSFLFALFL